MKKTIKVMRVSATVGMFALAMAGCGSAGNSTNAASPRPRASGGENNLDGAAGVPAGGTGSGGSAGQAALPQCHPKDVMLQAKVDADRDAPLPDIRVTLTNNSGRTCRIQGWPAVAQRNTRAKDGGKIHPLHVIRAGNAGTVVLRPHATAYTVLSHTPSDDGVDPGGKCRFTSSIGVSLPGSTVVRWAETNDADDVFCNGEVKATALAAR